jgi:hypothetical protein
MLIAGPNGGITDIPEQKDAYWERKEGIHATPFTYTHTDTHTTSFLSSSSQQHTHHSTSSYTQNTLLSQSIIHAPLTHPYGLVFAHTHGFEGLRASIAHTNAAYGLQLTTQDVCYSNVYLPSSASANKTVGEV